MAIAGSMVGGGGASTTSPATRSFSGAPYQSLPATGFNGIPLRCFAVNNPIAVIFTAIFMSMLDIIGLQLTNLTAYNEYITDVIIAAIVYLSAFRSRYPHDDRPKKNSAEPETEEAVTAEKADNADTEKGGDEA